MKEDKYKFINVFKDSLHHSKRMSVLGFLYYLHRKDGNYDGEVVEGTLICL